MPNNKIEIRQKIDSSVYNKLETLSKQHGYTKAKLIELAVTNFKVTSKLKIIV